MNHIIPYAEDIEKSILSNLINTEHCVGEDTLTADHFHFSAHKIIYRLIDGQPRPIDLTVMANSLIKSDDMDRIGGPAEITGIYTYQPTSAHFAQHLNILHNYKARRHALYAAWKLADSACDLSDDDLYIDNAGEPMTQVSAIASAASTTRSKKQIMMQLIQTILDRVSGKSSPMGWLTGIWQLDNALQGIHPHRLYIVAGYLHIVLRTHQRM